MGRNRGTITVATADNLKQNTTGQWSEILQYKIPRGYFAGFTTADGINMYLPTSDTLAHGGTGVETLDLTNNIVDSAMLKDDLTVKAYDPDDNVVAIDSVDYVNNTVDIDHSTEEDLKIVYLASGGSVRVSVYRPSAGTQSYTLFETSINTLHLMEQDNADSLLTLDDPFIAPAKYLIKIEVKADYQIDWTEDVSNKVAFVSIPFRKQNMKKMTQEHIQKINNLFISK